MKRKQYTGRRFLKAAAAAATAVMLLFTSGCGSAAGVASQDSDGTGLKIIATIFAPYDMARQVTGGRADVKMLLKPGSESHTYEPTPADIIAISNCDLFICSGGENDEWVETILEGTDNPDMVILRMLDCVEALEEEEVEGMQDEGGALMWGREEGHHHASHEDAEEDREHGEESGHDDGEHADREEEHGNGEHADHEEDGEEETEWDEHVWMSPANACVIADRICDICAKKDPGNASFFEANLSALEKELEEIDREIRETVGNAAVKEIVFADRFPARYFVEEYGIKYYAAFPGCSENAEASAATVSFLIDKVREDSIPYIFKIELSPGKLADVVSEETGAKVLTFYTGHNVTADDLGAGMTFADMFRRDLEALKLALN